MFKHLLLQSPKKYMTRKLFPLLAASVDHTIPGTNVKYKPGGPLSGLYFGPTDPSVTLFPNGSFSGTEDGSLFPQYKYPASDLNLHLLEAARLGPTLFPILFAAIVGSFLRLVARWRVETGSTVEDLELLVGSRSLASTVTTLFSLRTLGIVEISLVILWALSPIAGQASGRVLSSGLFKASTLTDVPWFATNITSVPVIDNDARIVVQSRYITRLVDTQNRAHDYLGPMLPMIAPNKSWALFTDSETNANPVPTENYTSLFGFDIIGPVFFATPTFNDQQYIKGKETVDFSPIYLNFTVSYFDFNCPSVTAESMDRPWLSILGPDLSQSNSSMLLQQAKLGSGFFISMNSTSEPHFSSQNIVFGSFYNSQVTLWNCLLSVITRDIRIFCTDDNAYSEGGNIQCSQLYGVGVATVSPITPFSNSTLASNVLEQWPLIDPASVGTSSLTEQYLAQGSNFTASHVDLSKLDSQTFSARLTTIFNTYIQTRQPSSIDGDFFLSDPTTWLRDTSHNQLSFMPFVLVCCHWVWFTILTIASTFLIVCTSLSIWLSHRLSTPDIMGYVSTLVQDHPHISDTRMVSKSSNSLDGLDRARLMKKVRVQIRDIGSNGEIGQFALTSDIKPLPETRKGRKWF